MLQEKSANICPITNLEYDLAGEVVLSPTANSTFAFQKGSDQTSPEFNIDLSSRTNAYNSMYYTPHARH